MRKKGIVTFKDQRVGIFEQMPNNGTCFTYDDSWLETSISTNFPINVRRTEWQNGLHPFFENLLSEGWLREGQAKVSGIREEYRFDLLLRFGKDCIGAVGIIDESTIYTNEQKWNEEYLSIQSHKTISGVQKKLLAYKENNEFYPSIDGKSATYIAKFDSQRINTLVVNEIKSLMLAQKILGKENVTKFEVADLLRERAVLIERFDRKNGKKLRMEEFAQILNKSVEDKYNGSYEEIAEAILKYSSLPQVDLDLYFKQLVFSIIIGNCDAHLKNFALLETESGMRLSPSYDLVNTLVYPEYDRVLALYMNGEKLYHDKIDGKILTDFGIKIGLKKSAIEATFAKFKEGIKKHLTVHPAEEPDSFNNRYKEIVDSACLRILE